MDEYLATSEEQHKDAARKALSLRHALEDSDNKNARAEYSVSSPPTSTDIRGTKEDDVFDSLHEYS
eukprot:9700304-Prorocentrum_lima.AAC.1